MTHHGAALRRLIKDESLAAQLEEHYARATLAPAGRAVLDYAATLTRSPATVAVADVQTLRDAGFADRATLDIPQITACSAFVNRMAEGLGMALEEY